MTFEITALRIAALTIAVTSIFVVACSSSSSTGGSTTSSGDGGGGGGSGVVYECCLGTSFYGCPSVPAASDCVSSKDAGTCARDESGDHECSN